MPILSLKTGTKSRSLLVGNPYFQPTAYESIATATGTGSAGNITFSSIPSTYSALQIRCLSKDTTTTGTVSDFTIRFNSDSTSGNYTRHELSGNGSAASAFGSATSQTQITIVTGRTSSAASMANIMGIAIIDIQDYANTSKYKTIRAMSGADTNTTDGRISINSGLWLSTSAINSISIIPNGTAWTTTSTFALYGIRGN